MGAYRSKQHRTVAFTSIKQLFVLYMCLPSSIFIILYCSFNQRPSTYFISLFLRHSHLEHTQITLLIHMIRSRLMSTLGMDETQRHGSPTPTDSQI